MRGMHARARGRRPGPGRLRRLAGCLCLILCASALTTIAAEAPLTVDGAYLLDPEGNLSWQEAHARIGTDAWRPLDPRQTRFGYTLSALWLHLAPPPELANLSRFQVLLEPAMLDEVRLFHVHDGRLVGEAAFELSMPFAEREMRERAFVLPVSGFDVGRDTLLLSVRTRGNLAVSGAFLDDGDLEAWSRNADVEAASLYGAMMVLLTLTTLMFLLTRVQSLAYLCLFVATTAGHYAVSHGTVASLAPDTSMRWAHHVYVFCVFGSGLAAIMFTRQALVLPRATPRLDRVILILGGAAGLGALSIPLVGVPTAYRLAGALALLANPVLIAAGVLRWRQGDRSARTIVLAWSLLLVGVMLMTLYRAGILPVALVNEDDTYALSVLCALLLTFTMIQRLLLLQEEPLPIDARLLDGLQASAAQGDRMFEDLEGSVRARNRELRGANERLEMVRAETERHAQTLNALFASTVSIHSAENVDDLLRSSLLQLSDLFPQHGFGIVLQGERPGDVRHRCFVRMSDSAEALIVDNAHLLGEGVRGTLRTLLADEDARERRAAIRNWQFIELGSNAHSTHGHLVIRGPELPARDLDVLGVFCTQIATAVDNRRLSAELEQLANTDPLTGVGNRKVFDRVIAQAIANASSRPRIDFCVLLADVNGLKEVNDTLGHETGDALIRHVAAALLYCIRREDTLTRTGGDEFVIICPGARHDIGEELARRISERLASRPLPHPVTGDALPVSLSIGTASSEELPPDDVVATADMRMYDAKERHYAAAPASARAQPRK